MRIRRFIVLLMGVIFAVGLSGCMKNQNAEVQMQRMEKYASDKYGREFTGQNFQAARDETYTNILSLSDGEYIFNVYQSNGYEAADDYPQAVVNKKFADNLKDELHYDGKIFANVMLTGGDELTLEYAMNNDMSAISKDYSFLKIILVVVVEENFSENISECIEELFEIYQGVMAFQPKYIDFEVIQTKNIPSDLDTMLHNLPGFYDNDWNKYSEVTDYFSVTDTNVGSVEELLDFY